MELTLKQDIGLPTGIAFVTGCIIGTGIFISPTPVLAGSGESIGIALFIWLGAGILTILGSLSFIELSLRIRKSGGTFIFLHEAYGSNVGFVYLWTELFIIRPTAATLGVQATGRYILRPLFLDCPEMSPKTAEDLLGILALCLFLTINVFGMKYTKYIICGITICKVGALVLIIIGGLIHLGEGKTSLLKDPFKVEKIEPKSLLFAFYTAIYAFYGGNLVNGIYEEIKNPNRSLVLAAVIGHMIPVVTYLMANVAYYAVLTKEEILSGITVAVVAHNNTQNCQNVHHTLCLVFGERRLGFFKWVILPCIAVSTAGIINNNLISSSRTTFVAARDGKFPKIFSMIDLKRRIPIPALLVVTTVIIIVDLTFDIVTLIQIFIFLQTSFDSMAILGILRIRKKYNHTGILKLPLIIPVVYVLVLLFCAVSTVIFSPEVMRLSVAVVGSGCLAKIIQCFGDDPTTKFGKLLANLSAFAEKILSRIFLCGRTEIDIAD